MWLLAFGMGCAALNVGGHRDVSTELERAQRQNDTAKIQAICDDESLGGLDKPYGVASGDDMWTNNNHVARRNACKALKDQKDDVDGSCGDLTARYEKATHPSTEPAKYYGRWATRFAKCNDYKTVFEKIAHVGDMGQGSAGEQILSHLTREGLPIEAEFVKYAEANRGPSFLGGEHSEFAANHIGNWLDKQKAFGSCGAIGAATLGSSEPVRANILFYFAHGNCVKETTAIGKSLLTSNVPNNRRLACVNLGNAGDKSAARDVKILAETDSFNEVVQDQRSGALLKQWTVREMCQEAYGKIQLRH